MKVYNKYPTGALQSHYMFYDFEKYQDQCGDFLFIDSPQVFTEIPKEIFNNKIVYLELEEPNRHFVNVDWFNHFDYDKYFSKIFSICPYTTKWSNDLYGTNKEHTFIPIKNPKINNDKLYDIVYAGHVFDGDIEKSLFDISKFNYRLVSNTKHKLTTDKSISNDEKLKIISQSKISLIHNLLYPTKEHISFIKTLPNYEKNEAFSLLDRGIVPQIKGRTFEAALCKSLILCQKDPFNVIEKYFEPGKEFIYYEKNKLSETIKEILNNYDDYLSVIDSAYIKALNYTTDAFFFKNLKDL